MKMDITFPTCACGVQSNHGCTLPVGQSEQTALVGRRDFVENEEFERGGA